MSNIRLIPPASMFKPALNDLRPALRDHAANLGYLRGPEPVIEGNGVFRQPDFAFVAGFEPMDMHPLRQIIAVKTYAIAVLEKNSWHFSVTNSSQTTSPATA